MAVSSIPLPTLDHRFLVQQREVPEGVPWSDRFWPMVGRPGFGVAGLVVLSYVRPCTDGYHAADQLAAQVGSTMRAHGVLRYLTRRDN